MSRSASFVSLHFSVLLFGLSGIVGKSSKCPAMALACVRSLIGAVALALYIAALRRSFHGTWRGNSIDLLIGGVALALHWWTFFYAIQLGGVALGLFTYAVYPLFISLFNGLRYGVRAHARELPSCLLIVVGLVLIAGGRPFDQVNILALISGLASGLFFAVLTVHNSKVSASMQPVVLAASQILVAGVLLLPFSLGNLPHIPKEEWPWLVLLGVVFTALAHALFIASLPKLPLAVVGSAAALEPVYGIVAAWALLQETPRLSMLIGGLLIVASNFVNVLLIPFEKPPSEGALETP